jgi:hypothetical protein
MRRLISLQTAWIGLLLVLSYFCVSVLTVYFVLGSFGLDWELGVGMLIIPGAQTLTLRLLKKLF